MRFEDKDISTNKDDAGMVLSDNVMHLLHEALTWGYHAKVDELKGISSISYGRRFFKRFNIVCDWEKNINTDNTNNTNKKNDSKALPTYDYDKHCSMQDDGMYNCSKHKAK